MGRLVLPPGADALYLPSFLPGTGGQDSSLALRLGHEVPARERHKSLEIKLVAESCLRGRREGSEGFLNHQI